MKKFLCALLALAVMALPTGCKKAEDPSSSAPEPEQAEENLVVYSPLPRELAQAAVDGFWEQSGVEVTLVCDSTEALIRRIGTGGEENRADVLFGAGAEAVQQFSELFDPYSSVELGSLDERLRDPNGVWTPFSPMPIVLLYNKEQTTQAPQGWGSLIFNSYGGWVAFADPSASGTSYTALCAMRTAMEGPELTGDEYISQLAENLQGKMLPSISDVYRSVASGEFAAGVTLESSAVKYLEAGYEDLVGISYPADGTTVALEVSAVTASSRQAGIAQEFIDYVSGEAFQSRLAREFGMRPARADVEGPEGLTPLEDIVLVEYDYEQAVEQRDALLALFSEAEQRGAAAQEEAAA